MCVVAYLLSLPLWERGFKLNHVVNSVTFPGRSPCGSVDLNANFVHTNTKRLTVAPLVGAWI